MPAPLLRIAVLGAGLVGREHCKLLKANPRAELACVVDSNQEAATEAALLGGCDPSQIGADCQATLNKSDIDAVIVALPNMLHEAAGIYCAERKLPALIEKPIADTIPAAQRIAEAFEKTRTPALIGHHRRHSPDIRRARDAIHNGEIGELVAVSGAWIVSKPEAYFDVAWRREKGGGPVLINLIHDLDCLRFIAGEIVSVQAVSAHAARGFDVEDTVALTLRFASGAIGSFILSDAAPSPYAWETTSGQALYFPHQPENCYTFAGRTATLTTPSMTVWQHEAPKPQTLNAAETKLEARLSTPNIGHWQDKLISRTLSTSPGSAYADQLNHFLDIAEGLSDPVIGPRDATVTLATALAVLEAARTGHAVSPSSLL